jgi:hypothetical protein
VAVVVHVVVALILVAVVECYCQPQHRHLLIRVDVGSGQQRRRLSFPQDPSSQPEQFQPPDALPLLEVHSYKWYHIEEVMPHIVVVAPISLAPNLHCVVCLLLQQQAACFHQRDVPIFEKKEIYQGSD